MVNKQFQDAMLHQGSSGIFPAEHAWKEPSAKVMLMSPATMAPGRALGSGLADRYGRYGHVRVLWPRPTPFEQRPHCRAGRLRRCGYVVAPFPEARASIYHIV